MQPSLRFKNLRREENQTENLISELRASCTEDNYSFIRFDDLSSHGKVVMKFLWNNWNYDNKFCFFVRQTSWKLRFIQQN